MDEHPDVKAVYPIHMNPECGKPPEGARGDDRIRIIEPLEVVDFHNFMAASYLVLTDSGGIQEEAPSLGKPVLVMRDTTERPEGVACGTLRLVGTEEEAIYSSFSELLESEASLPGHVAGLEPLRRRAWPASASADVLSGREPTCPR